MPSDRLFGPGLSTPALLDATSPGAWVQAMLDFEAALARVQAAAGVIPAEAALRVAAACDAGSYDLDSIAERSAAAANPAVPLVHDLTEAAGAAGGWVHWGATSQDVIDTAAMLVARRGMELVGADLDRAAAAAARLAERHRETPAAARTLLQQALPTTFGLRVAGWLSGLMAAGERLSECRERVPAVQLGGAVGTQAAFGRQGPGLAAALARELGLAEPLLPWHAERSRIAELAAVLALVAGAAGKVAVDVVLLAQTEVGEVAEGGGPGRGASSTMPQKRNPAGATLALAAARTAQSAAGLLVRSMIQEQERSPGWWQLEWDAISEALRMAGGAVARVAEVLEGLEVDEARMRLNLEATGGLVLAESVMIRLAERTGRARAHDLVGAAARRARAGEASFRDALLADEEIASALGPDEIAAALEPSAYLGAAEEMVDRVLAAYQARRQER